MTQMLVLKPGYAFVDFDDKGGHKVIAARPADPEKRGTDEEYAYPAADRRIGRKQLFKFFPLGNPDASASAHREATETMVTQVIPADAEETLSELADAEDEEAEDADDSDEEEPGENADDPLAGLEA
jgi:hypothetical protein